MDLSAVYQELCAAGAEAFDVDLATAIDDLAGRLHRLEWQLTLTVPRDAVAIRNLLIDDVIRIGIEFGRLGAVDDQVLARSIVVELLRPIGAEHPLDLANALGLLASLLSEAERWAEAITYSKECAEVLRPFAIAAADDGARLYGRALQDCGAYLARLERWEEAVAVKREALAVFERCLADGPRFRPDVAVTANELFDLLIRTGEAAEALEVSERAIGIMREMQADGVSGWLHNLALIAGDRSSVFLDLDRRPEALESGAEAVDALRALASENPTAYLGLLALALGRLSGPLAATGRHEEALAAAVEAVQIADELELDDPWIRSLVQWSYGQRLTEHGYLVAAKDAYLVALPKAQAGNYTRLAPELNDLSRLLAEHGWVSEAAEVVTSAVLLYEQLAAADPEWTASYADTLGWLTELQSRCGWDEAALRTAERGVEIAQTVVDRAFLARALGHLGSSLAGARLHEEAEKASRAALELWQELAEKEPERYLNGLAGAWHNLGNRLGVLDRIEEAAAAGQRAAELYDPDSPDRANALNSLSVRLEQLGRRPAARDTAYQAIAIYEALAEAEPGLRPQLAAVLGNLAGYHSALNEREEAATASNRAASILYDLYSVDPGPFQADLLRMLRRTAGHLVMINRFDLAAEAARLRAEVIEAGGEHGVELAETLADLGGYLIGLERFDDAAQVLQRAEGICVDMGGPPGLHAFVLDKLAWCRFRLGPPEESVRLARHGIELLEPIQADDANPHLPELGVLLNDLCGYLRACNRPLEALEAVSRAVSIRERLTSKHPLRHREPLGHSLRNLADVLGELGRHRQAEEITRRAEELEQGPPAA